MIVTLQSLRFVFVMLIFLSHFSYQDIEALDAGGDCGVTFFFLLSGFVCSLGYGTKIGTEKFSYFRFLWRRIRKFYPLHLLCLVLFLVVSMSSIDIKVVLNLLLLQSWVPDSDFYFSCNSVSWFLSSLLCCYLLFPLTYRYLSKRLTIGIMVIYGIIYWITPYDRVNSILYVFPLVRFVDFYLGMVLCQFYLRHQNVVIPNWMEILSIIFLLVSLAIYPFMDEKFRNAPLYWLVLIPLILIFAHQQGIVSKWLRTRHMALLGSLSLPLFLTHQMLIGFLTHHLPEMHAILMLTICIFIALIVSWGIQIIFSRIFRL